MAKTLKTAALALIAPGILASAAPALAHDNGYGSYGDYNSRGSQQDAGWNHSDRYRDGYDRNSGYGYNGRGYNDGGYYQRRGYDEPVYRNTRTWRGDDGRTYCRRQDGTTGLLIGGAVGGLIGHEAAGRRGDRTLGAILGAGVGALIGREVDKSSSRCR